MASETPRTSKGKSGSIKAGKSRGPRTAHAAHGTPKHAAQANAAAKVTAQKGTTPRPTRVATSVKKRA
jgi:hypothetical protein